jgi:hypothetical protein
VRWIQNKKWLISAPSKLGHDDHRHRRRRRRGDGVNEVAAQQLFSSLGLREASVGDEGFDSANSETVPSAVPERPPVTLFHLVDRVASAPSASFARKEMPTRQETTPQGAPRRVAASQRHLVHRAECQHQHERRKRLRPAPTRTTVARTARIHAGARSGCSRNRPQVVG